MMINGSLYDDKQVISAHVQGFFMNLFGDDRNLKPPLEFVSELILASITSAHNQTLVRIPSEEEVRAAVYDLCPVSVLGPNEFGGIFSRESWDIIRIYITMAMGFFFN